VHSAGKQLSRAIIQIHKDCKPHQHDRQTALQTDMLCTNAQPQQYGLFLDSATGCFITFVLQGWPSSVWPVPDVCLQQ